MRYVRFDAHRLQRLANGPGQAEDLRRCYKKLMEKGNGDLSRLVQAHDHDFDDEDALSE